MSCQRFYTHSIVSYATLDECVPLLQKSKHYAYIVHDKDVADKHIHILATFSTMQSITAVRKLVVSSQNTFSQECKDVEALLDYFTHENEENEKFKYSKRDIGYDDYEYWRKRINNGEVVESANDMFVDDLLSEKMSLEFMARKYGRDFMKNYKSYLDFRREVLFERGAYI